MKKEFEQKYITKRRRTIMKNLFLVIVLLLSINTYSQILGNLVPLRKPSIF
jgi:hypothetical protein